MIQDVFSVAGYNSLGGASIHSDIKAISTNCANPMAAINALTIQNTQGVIGIYLVLPPSVVDQVNAVSADFQMNEGLVSMIINADIVQVVSDVMWPGIDVSIILDPVIIAKVGALLLEDDTSAPVSNALMTLAIIITSKIPEAAHLLGSLQATKREEMLSHGRALCALGLNVVLMKCAHLDGDKSPDVLITDIGANWFNSPEVRIESIHGTSCILSAMIAAQIAQAFNLPEAVSNPKTYFATEILQADQFYVGSGCHPAHHFANLNN